MEETRPINEMKIVVPSLSVNESVARSVIAAFCAQLDPSATELADVKCAVSEAVTNCIVHAYVQRTGMIYITAVLRGSVLRVIVRDKGCGIADVEKAREPLFTTDAAGERSGMGFAVMENFMDRLTVHSRPDKGTVIVMSKRIGCSVEKE